MLLRNLRRLPAPAGRRKRGGDNQSTAHAARATPRRAERTGSRTTRILDLGCGNGGPTVTLAQHTQGSILAVDNHQPYLDELQRRAAAAGVSARIRVSLRDMHSLEKSDGPFDLIWSEGSLFVMGWREGLAACHSLLSPGGELAVSELCWLRPDPPADCRRYFDMAYPALADIETNLAVIRACDYEVIGHFTLPESAGGSPTIIRSKSACFPARAARRGCREAVGGRVYSGGDRPLPPILRVLRLRVLSDATPLTLLNKPWAPVPVTGARGCSGVWPNIPARRDVPGTTGAYRRC